ncbi:MAG: AAA family ATPase [Lachnospiraceae bacterium]
MKPISVKFQCFGPYVEKQQVNFENLEKHGLFLICGETGAGKTTILDAICYALYGESSGGQRGELSAMRCKLAPRDMDTVVEFIFDVNGKRYQFTRTLICKRVRIVDVHNCGILENGSCVPIFENPTKSQVKKKAEEIIGLNVDQFRQVIILPQGKFERLLVSNSDDKEKILVSLFRADKWQKIAAELKERIAAQDRELSMEHSAIQVKLKDYQCPDLTALAAYLEDCKVQLQQLEEELQQAKQAEAGAKDRHEVALVDNQGFIALAERQRQVVDLAAQQDAVEAEKQLLRKADLADQIKPEFESYLQAQQKNDQAVQQHEKAVKAFGKAVTQLDEVKQADEFHKDGYAENEERKIKINWLANLEEVYASVDFQKEKLENARKVETNNLKSHKDAEAQWTRANDLWLATRDNHQEKRDEHTRAQRDYLDSISGVLAGALKDNEPCPVCGSTSHPAPAASGETSITAEALEHYSKAENDARDKEETAHLNRDAAEKARMAANEAYNTARSQAAAAETAYQANVRQMQAGIETSAQLTQVLEELAVAVETYAREEKRISLALSDATANYKVAQKELEQSRQDAETTHTVSEETRTRWGRQLADSEFSTEEEYKSCLLSTEAKNQKRERVARHEANQKSADEALQTQQEKLYGKEQPDLQACQDALEEAGKLRNEKSKNKILAHQKTENLKKDLAELTHRQKQYDKQHLEVDENLEFANRLSPRSGLSLQRYVLGVMLSTITAEANRLLQGVHNGRYRLYRSNEKSSGSNHTGLALDVLDSQSDERRSVTTLSGGEKFLVALSLAIGLSTVVQAQGRGLRIHAMFVDEGFGSLDENSITDALEILHGIQRAHGLVGIISHVELLKNEIPCKIEITKSNRGSRIYENY